MTPLRILFVSTGNACRSQMAEGWVRHLAAEGVIARSAGTEPRHLHPLATRAMQELGVDIGHQRGKGVQAVRHERFDLVVTLCETAAQSLPPLPLAKATLHRPFDDPSLLESDDDADIETYRALRDELRTFVDELLRERRGD